jgi:glycosyltransferase involved in cell wall biosynthesis
MPVLFSALDVGVISNLDSAFGRACFPQKLYEMLACNTLVVGARVGAVAELLRSCPGQLFEPNSDASLAQAIAHALDQACRPTLQIPDWKDQGAILEAVLQGVVER